MWGGAIKGNWVEDGTPETAAAVVNLAREKNRKLFFARLLGNCSECGGTSIRGGRGFE